jgi:hypothetical protein
MSGLLGKGLTGIRVGLEQYPQPVLKQFYDLRIFLVCYPHTYPLEGLVVHRNSVEQNHSQICSLVNTFEACVRYRAHRREAHALLVGTVRLVGSNANNVFSSVASATQ